MSCILGDIRRLVKFMAYMKDSRSQGKCVCLGNDSELIGGIGSEEDIFKVIEEHGVYDIY